MLISLVSCETTLDEPCLTNIQKAEQEDIGKYTIPISDVLEELEKSMPIFTDENTSPKEIKEVITIYPKDKNGLFTALPILYAINFKNDNGYAVMAADYRIKGSLLSFVEKGNTQINDFFPNEELLEEMREYYKDFPFYNEELNEYYMGSPTIPIHPNTTTLAYATSCVEFEEWEMDLNKYSYSYGDWNITGKVPALIKTAWGQGYPFNEYAPYRNKGVIIGNKRHAPAGCVPIAIAQIVAYHQNANVTIKDQKIDLKLLEKHIYNVEDWHWQESDNEKFMLGYFVRTIGALCDSWYTYWGTFTFPTKTTYCFKTFGFINPTTRWRYMERTILRMLEKKNPVLIMGVSSWDSGHGWVIDGYINRYRKVYRAAITEYIKKEIEPEYQLLVHCNWGWTRRCNGYYHSGIFNLNNGAVIPDLKKKDKQTSDSYYRFFPFTITYDGVQSIDTKNLNF